MTPKENIIKQDIVMANSPKRKHGGSSPGKLKGSFLHKAFTSDKCDRFSPFKVRYCSKGISGGCANSSSKMHFNPNMMGTCLKYRSTKSASNTFCTTPNSVVVQLSNCVFLEHLGNGQ